MGFACSPVWCNLYFFWYESTFILRLATLKRQDLLPLFKHCHRYIDDLGVFNNPQIRSFLNPNANRAEDNPYWIYPLPLVEIKECIAKEKDLINGQKLITAINFLNLSLELKGNGSFLLQPYDKTQELPFKILRFVSLHANRPIVQSYKMILSQVFPIPYLCNELDYAKKRIDFLVDQMVVNRFRKSRLIGFIRKFLQNNSFPGALVDISELCNLLR
jgi:hypothetical protein